MHRARSHQTGLSPHTSFVRPMWTVSAGVPPPPRAKMCWTQMEPRPCPNAAKGIPPMEKKMTAGPSCTAQRRGNDHGVGVAWKSIQHVSDTSWEAWTTPGVRRPWRTGSQCAGVP